MDGTASGLSACHQHDILSRQAMMYLLTRGWSLAHTSLAMTPEHSDISAEYCCLKPARAEHSRSMCLSSPKAPVRHNLQTRLLRGNRTCLPCSMGSKWAPMRNLKSLCSLALPMGTSQYVGHARPGGRENQRWYVHTFTPSVGHSLGSNGIASIVTVRSCLKAASRS